MIPEAGEARVNDGVATWLKLGVAVLLVTLALVGAVGWIHHRRTIAPEQYAAWVGAAYGDTQAQVARVHPDVTDDPSRAPMYSIQVDGDFHNGSLHATHLAFSALQKRRDAWAIRAWNDDGSPGWIDPELPGSR